MSLKLSIQHVGGPSLPEVAAALRSMDNRRVGGIYRRALRPHFRGLQREIRASIMAIPSKKSGSPEPLRLRLVKCVRVASWVGGPETGVMVFMDVSRMPQGERALPLYEEGSKAPWRHPVWGNRDIWVSQRANPYFHPVIAAHRGTERVALDRAEQEVARRLLA